METYSCSTPEFFKWLGTAHGQHQGLPFCVSFEEALRSGRNFQSAGLRFWGLGFRALGLKTWGLSLKYLACCEPLAAARPKIQARSCRQRRFDGKPVSRSRNTRPDSLQPGGACNCSCPGFLRKAAKRSPRHSGPCLYWLNEGMKLGLLFRVGLAALHTNCRNHRTL